jgi:thiaminase
VYAKYYERYIETYHLPEYDENVEPSLKIIEEMFADDYSNHLTSFSQTNVLENLFR